MSDESTAAAVVAAGRRQYEQKRYKAAIATFTKAMRSCPCNRKSVRPRCTCKNFEKVAAEHGSIFDEAMYRCTCEVGRTFSKCDRPRHIQALDYRAATFEALKELERARKDAEWVLELAPRLPEGYLRLGKIAMLSKKYEFAWRLYNAAISVCASTSDASKLKQLFSMRKSLARRFVKLDPITSLPVEIVQSIFLHLNFHELVQCLGVSKGWRGILTAPGYSILWRNLTFGQGPHRQGPSRKSLLKYIGYSHGDARSIVFQEASVSRLDLYSLLGVLRNLSKLQTLSFRLPPTSQFPNNMAANAVLPRTCSLPLQRLSFVREDSSEVSDHFIHSILSCAAGTLVDLDLTGLHTDLTGSPIEIRRSHYDLMAVPRMENLKTFRLRMDDMWFFAYSMLLAFAKQTPKLEQLCLGNWSKLSTSTLDFSEFSDYWKALQVVHFETSHPEQVAGLAPLLGLHGGRCLRNVSVVGTLNVNDLPCEAEIRPERGLPLLSPSRWRYTTNLEEHEFCYDQLRSLQLQSYVMDPERAAVILDAPLREQKLHTLGIVFPLSPYTDMRGRTSRQHLHSYQFLEGSPSIKHLSLYSFYFGPYLANDSDFPLPRFLQSFPNLKTLELVPSRHEDTEVCVIIEAVIERTKLETVYQQQVSGGNLERLRSLSRAQGVTLTTGARPRPWPVPGSEIG